LPIVQEIKTNYHAKRLIKEGHGPPHKDDETGHEEVHLSPPSHEPLLEDIS